MRKLLTSAVLAVLSAAPSWGSGAEDVARLIAAMIGETPMIDDLRALTDEIGGRPTGSEANRRAVEWAAERFREAGVEVHVEVFEMPALWLERSAAAHVEGDVEWPVRIAAMPFSTGTGGSEMSAPLVDGGRGTESDFGRLGMSAKGAFVLIGTDELEDIPGLFKEYTDAAAIESRAYEADVAGIVYMGSRPRDVLYRHNASRGPKNDRPMMVMERGSAQRLMRLLKRGKQLRLRVEIDVEGEEPTRAITSSGRSAGAADRRNSWSWERISTPGA